MKKLLTLTMITLMLVAFGVATAEAANPATISVTVTITASGLSVSVSPDTWAIGNILEEATPNTTLPDYFSATNDRNDGVIENLTITAVSSADWTFANTPGADQFGMNFSTAGAIPEWTLIDSVSGGTLATGLAAGASEGFDLQLEAPTTTTAGGTAQTITVTVTAS